MANPKQLALLKKSVARWNAWRTNPDVAIILRVVDLTGTDLIRANLSGADLSYAHLVGAHLNGADLSGADLSYAHLSDADLSHTVLRGANLSDADLSYANHSGADLSHAVLRGAHLSGADLSGAVLSGANLSGAVLSGANFSSANLSNASFDMSVFAWTAITDTDLSVAKGLETVEHKGPSSVGLDTIYKSGGNIPEVFLRGCGVPENFIEYMHSLVGKPLEFYTCFISHSSKDMAFSTRLYNDLQGSGVRCWFFPEDAKWGEPVWGEIDRTIRVYDKLVVVCSKHSLQSGPVLREIERALQREDREGKNILFPITLDRYVFDDWEHPRKADVVAKVIGSFAGWNRGTAKYAASFKKLLSALPAPASATVARAT